MAPHQHVGLTDNPASFIGSTRVEPCEKWPDNFSEDPECEGCGVWTCQACDGSGKLENPIAMLDDDVDEDDPDPWPFGDFIVLMNDGS